MIVNCHSPPKDGRLYVVGGWSIRVAAGEEEKVGLSFRFPLCLFQIMSTHRDINSRFASVRFIDRTSEFIPTVEN
jgi:hypothetical protein